MRQGGRRKEGAEDGQEAWRGGHHCAQCHGTFAFLLSLLYTTLLYKITVHQALLIPPSLPPMYGHPAHTLCPATTATRL